MVLSPSAFLKAVTRVMANAEGAVLNLPCCFRSRAECRTGSGAKVITLLSHIKRTVLTPKIQGQKSQLNLPATSCNLKEDTGVKRLRGIRPPNERGTHDVLHPIVGRIHPGLWNANALHRPEVGHPRTSG